MKVFFSPGSSLPWSALPPPSLATNTFSLCFRHFYITFFFLLFIAQSFYWFRNATDLKKSPLSRVHHLWHSLQTTVARENILYHLWSKHLKFHFDLWDILDCLWVNVVILESGKGVENGDVGLTQQTDGAGQKYKPEKHSYSLLIATNNNHNHLNYQNHSNYCNHHQHQRPFKEDIPRLVNTATLLNLSHNPPDALAKPDSSLKSLLSSLSLSCTLPHHHQ